MAAPGSALDPRVRAALDAEPSRIPVVLGGDGTGRTALLRRLRHSSGVHQAQYVDLERTLTTPDRLLGDLLAGTRFEWAPPQLPDTGPGTAFARVLDFLTSARTDRAGPALFLLDEILELRTFDSFPGLRGMTRGALEALAESGNRFVLTSRYVSRALRLLRDASARFLVLHPSPVSPSEVAPELADLHGLRLTDAEEFSRAAVTLSDGRHAYVTMIVQQIRSDARRSTDPIAALVALLSEGGALAARCCHCYEMRLHRARGYGALKAILDILSEEEPLTLTEIALRLRRTPGSTKDYLSWLEDVDLVRSNQKRYAISDPILRLWITLHCKPEPPTDEEVAREVQRYALARLPASETPPPERPVAARQARDRQRDSGIIEID
jgi:hypothetical protein